MSGTHQERPPAYALFTVGATATVRLGDRAILLNGDVLGVPEMTEDQAREEFGFARRNASGSISFDVVATRPVGAIDSQPK